MTNRTDLAPLTEIERDLLEIINECPIDMMLVEHFKPESYAAFNSLKKREFIDLLSTGHYDITPAGRAALDTSAEAER